jgi:hypothetical protein
MMKEPDCRQLTKSGAGPPHRLPFSGHWQPTASRLSQSQQAFQEVAMKLAATIGIVCLALALPAQAQQRCVKQIKGVDDGSTVMLNDPCSLEINGDIDSRSMANIASGGFIHLHGKIDGKSRVTLNAGQDIVIDDKIDGGSQVHLHAGLPKAPGPIVIVGKIDDGKTSVTWCGASFSVEKGVEGGARAVSACP